MEFTGQHPRQPPQHATIGEVNREKMVMSASVGAATVESDETREAARDERAFFVVLAAVIALEGYGLAWFLG